MQVAQSKEDADRMTDKEKLKQIKKIADKHHKERYDTDWDDMQKRLYKIWEIVYHE